MSLATPYVMKLPRGLDSYEHCRAKGSLVSTTLKSRPLDPETVDARLQSVLREVRLNEWVPEVHFLTLMLLVRDKYFRDDEGFLSWVKAQNAQLFTGPLYRALMFVATTRFLIAGANVRWRQFHQGTTLIAQHGDGKWVDFNLRYEPNLLTPLHVRMYLSAIEASLEACGAGFCRSVGVEVSVAEASGRIEW